MDLFLIFLSSLEQWSHFILDDEVKFLIRGNFYNHNLMLCHLISLGICSHVSSVPL